MTVFSQRRKGYKAGVVLLLLSAVTATWGVIAPGWLRSDGVNGERVVYSDLWFINCQHGFYQCQTAEFSNEDASVMATLGLSCLGLVLMLCSCAVVIRANFCLTVPTYGRTAEVLALFAGLTLFIGCMTYVGDNADFLQDYPSLHYGPSFIVSLSSSLLAGLGGILLSVYNKRPGTSYYSPFHQEGFSIPIASSAVMVGAASTATTPNPILPPLPTTTTITVIPAHASSVQNAEELYYYPEKNSYGSLCGAYPPTRASLLRQPGGANSVYCIYGGQPGLYSSYHNSPIFR
ncbi:hypothetical protein ACOMHN_059610 [Nucella lapillus]